MNSDTALKIEGGRRTLGLQRSEPPLVTVITVVFRACAELEKILHNIFEHDSTDFELIVIDGGSQDGTVDMLCEWNDRIEYWVSEPDKGIFDAMNKAQSFARGHFLLHINAGDKLLLLPREELKQAFRDRIDVVTFPVTVDGTRVFRPSCGPMLRLKNTLHHQGTFYRRETFLPYDLSYPMLADFDLNQRLALRGAKMRAYDKVVAWHASGGAGDSIDGYAEHTRIMLTNYGRLHLYASIALSEWKGIKSRRKAAFLRWLAKYRGKSSGKAQS
ncbi:MAG TPA: glycosyltransferase [Acidobacteriaceae bacterium]|nr:glycosyltransferase [Acidobacteriaceae bacterium]